ncbi:hypothetical protein [Candidatus Lucifugimonas marina]|uniref:Uncharacterized protein n=1 Tax=Candidatus Lucifugimonas marina TaxID=3038979 RepID=A0AAJ6CRT3_9CHLR|nr:hypothetical protein [SAR202 cluster bacterium JH702]MDG0868989.1 hypothetical protein [SAR202 cluster bacterium JH639]WFG35614.1 hypothetical protein GKN94_07880 [SAR202 cluster bacterium JH545]WFG39561.1 hypothetical protein GKO48_07995 [SAR202 cluster bacterium JH1073]
MNRDALTLARANHGVPIHDATIEMIVTTVDLNHERLVHDVQNLADMTVMSGNPNLKTEIVIEI